MGVSIVPFFQYIFYSQTSSSSYYDGIVRFYSTFQEPAHAAPFFAGIFWFRIVQSDRYNKIITILMLVALLLSLGMTGYAGFAIGAIVYLFTNKNAKSWIEVISLGFVALIFLYASNFGERIINAVISKQYSFTRHAWNEYALLQIRDTYGFGVGIGTAGANSLLINLVAKTGIIGATIYLVSRFDEFKNIMRLRKNRIYYGLLLYEVTVFSAQCISESSFTYSVFWFGFFIYALLIHNANFYGTKYS